MDTDNGIITYIVRWLLKCILLDIALPKYWMMVLLAIYLVVMDGEQFSAHVSIYGVIHYT